MTSSTGFELRLREALGQAQRRDVLDLEVRKAETDLVTLLAMTVADPQSETAAKLVTWATASVIRITADDVAMLRILGMVLLPQMAGLVMMFAMALGTRSRSPGGRDRD